MTLDDIIQETKTYYCLECGKCTSLCPIARYDPQFSPRAMIETALFGSEDDIVYNKKLFSCLTCSACQLKCPSDVDFPLFMQKARTLATAAGQNGDYAHSGTLQSISRLMAKSPIKQNRLEWLKESECRTSDTSDIMLFIGCSPYFEPAFDDIPVHPLDIAKASIKILNSLDIEPLVHPDEKCCGHDALWLGDIETFKKLAEHNASIIKESGVKKIIFFCPEGYRTLKLNYPEYGFGLDCELQHISEFLAQRMGKNELKFKELKKRVTYQDPCRLGRHLEIYDAPRKVLQAIPGIELVEMEHNKEESICCGTSCWTNCDSYSKQIRVERLLEAKSTSADILITTCPKCQTHFKCAMTNKGKEKGTDIEIEVMDLVNLVANAMESQE